jgi:hypothetical protein
VVPIFRSLIVALSLAGAAARPAAHEPGTAEARTVSIDVPYVPQTEALCGGAAVAMVFRYWGEPHAAVQEFATLVDRRAHGIVTDVLVRAVEERHWLTNVSPGSIDTLKADLAAAHPPIILIEDRPQRYHYVVVVGVGMDHVVVHDPAWGPSRKIAERDLMRRWAATGFWSLVISPTATIRLTADTTNDTSTVRLKADTTNDCDELLARAVDEIQREGLTRADSILAPVRAQCPRSPGPFRELAGVRFTQRRWHDASVLAEQAAAIDPTDEYAWEVLGSSRFMEDDVVGALHAWNQIGKPRIDSVRIEGLTRTRYALVAEALRLPTGALLTPERFRRAQRRLEQLPDASNVRLGFRPQSDGFGAIDVAVVESAPQPHGATEWVARGVETAVEREIAVAVPGGTGQGEEWAAAWRWWSNRPRIDVALAAPRFGSLPGVWRVEASWERQTFQSDPRVAPIQEDHTRGGLSTADWLTANLRFGANAGLDSWNGSRRAVSIGGTLEQRAFADRLSIAAEATAWVPLTSNSGFNAAALRAAFVSSSVPAGTVGLVNGGFELVSAAAPMSLWVGAGDGHARTPLLRAHPLLAGGIITGGTFGRRLGYATGELQQWLGSWPARFGVAAFLDVARAAGRAPTATGDPLQIDAGGGVRFKAPGRKGTLRVDVGRGLRDQSVALTVGWQR